MIKQITVIGVGLMGTQIAIAAVNHGYKVICYDVNFESLKRAKSYCNSWYQKQCLYGPLPIEEFLQRKQNLSFSDNLESSIKDSDLIIEAVSDTLSAKKDVLRKIDNHIPTHCIIASNSSYIVSSLFCNVVKDPSKVINMHFFNPVLKMDVVEVVKGPHVSDETFNTILHFVRSINKTPIIVEQEIYGSIVNRIFRAITREACYLTDIGIASPQEIDKAVKGALGHPMGPFETLDLTGIDLEYQVYMENFKSTGNVEDLPASCISFLYEKGWYGHKSGKGFYDYNQKE
ncbi:MAG: 3-hydroxyacyl-CoA dehydrogenase family protein [Firmicutes bacterium]|nr:3-hydroxyacyl-CoA dehydrogenase family protein [Bacillota bacterium]